jgi:hypothetical protein
MSNGREPCEFRELLCPGTVLFAEFSGETRMAKTLNDKFYPGAC